MEPVVRATSLSVVPLQCRHPSARRRLATFCHTILCYYINVKEALPFFLQIALNGLHRGLNGSLARLLTYDQEVLAAFPETAVRPDKFRTEEE